MTQIPKASDFSPNADEKRGETVLFVDVAAGQFNFACNIAHGILRVGLHFRYR